MKILLVEDEIPVAATLADSIAQAGHEVMVAHDGEEGLVLVRENRPDAVFLDVMLGELSGIDVLRHIRKSNPDLPVILITGQALPEQLEEARRLGVTEILQKPFILKQLTRALAVLERC